MKTISKILVSVYFLLNASLAVAQSSSSVVELEKLLYRAYLTTSKTLWTEAIDKAQQYPFESEQKRLHYMTEAQSGLVIYALANQDEATFDTVCEDLKDNLKSLIKNNKNDARAHALLANAYGAEIAFTPTKGMYLGSRSSGHIQKALDHDPTSAIAWFQQANSKLFTPAMFGGSVDEAVSGFEKSVAYYEAQGRTEANWRYLNALAWLGIAYEKADNTQKAIEVYQKALTVEPDFGWVKYALLPKAQGNARAAVN